MDVNKEDFFHQAQQLKINPEHIEALWNSLEKQVDNSKSSTFSKFLYYFGSIIVIAAMSWMMQLGWTTLGGGGKFIVALIYAILFAGVGIKLWNTNDLKTPGGFCTTIAVCMVPFAIYGLLNFLNIEPNDSPNINNNFFGVSNFTQICMYIGTIFAGLIALRFVPFPFTTAPIFFASWLLIMNVSHLITGDHFFFEQSDWFTLSFGLVLICIAYLLDINNKKEYAFWGYLFGILAFWISITTLGMNKGPFFKFVYFIINFGMMLLSIILNRKVFLIFGVLGVFIYLNYLAFDFFENSFIFPLTTSLIGITIIYLGGHYQKNSKKIEKMILDAIPESMKRYLP